MARKKRLTAAQKRRSDARFRAKLQRQADRAAGLTPDDAGFGK